MQDEHHFLFQESWAKVSLRVLTRLVLCVRWVCCYTCIIYCNPQTLPSNLTEFHKTFVDVTSLKFWIICKKDNQKQQLHSLCEGRLQTTEDFQTQLLHYFSKRDEKSIIITERSCCGILWHKERRQRVIIKAIIITERSCCGVPWHKERGPSTQRWPTCKRCDWIEFPSTNL